MEDSATQMLTLLIAMGVEAFLGLAPYIDNVSHITGFATGLLFGLIFCHKPKPPVRKLTS